MISSSPRKIRQSNSVAALHALFDRGRCSRTELAQYLGLNRSSSGHIVAQLAANSLVREVPEDVPVRSGRAGRPGILLELVPDAAYFLGAEIGVEHITTVLIDLVAEVSICRVQPFSGRSVTARNAVHLAVSQAFDKLPPEVADRIEGFGLSAPAQMDRDGKVRVAPLLGWHDENIAALIQGKAGGELPIQVENDANAFAFGESYCNRKARSGVTLFLVIETGVGGGIVIDGKVFRGGHGLAGEIGHLRVRDGRELEEVLGLGYLLDSYASRLDRELISFTALLQDVRDRVPDAVEIAEQWAQDLAGTVAAACHMIDPSRVVLGGSVAALYPLVEARVSHYLAQLRASTFPMPEITVHQAAQSGAAFGAACLLHRRFLSLDNQNLTGQTGNSESYGP